MIPPLPSPLYKVVRPNGEPCHLGSGPWSIPHYGQPGDWRQIDAGKLWPCHHGLHLCRIQDLPGWLVEDAIVCEVEAAPRFRWILHNDEKVVVRKARLTRIVGTLDARLLRLFACDCAKRALLREHERGREPDPRSWAAIEVTRRFAVGEATQQELAAAHAAAYAAYAYAAAAVAARDAARAAYATRDAERLWQGQHLIRMLGAQQ